MIFRAFRVDNGNEVNINLNQVSIFFDGSAEGQCEIQMTNGVTLNVKTTARKVRTQFRRLASGTEEAEAPEAPVAPAPAPAPVAEEAAPVAPTPEPAIETTPSEESAPLVQAADAQHDAPPAPVETNFVGYNEPA